MTQSEVKPVKAEETKQQKVAIVYAGHGQTWACGSEPNIVLATRAAKKAKRDWKAYGYKIPKEHIFTAYLYDLTEVEDLWGFDGDSGRVYDDKSKKDCPFLEKLQVVA